jgi:predicted GNAT family acetyltransferase
MNQRSWGLLRVLSKWKIQEYPSNSPEIAYIFVHEEARGKGIGDLLIKMSCNLCVEGSQNYLYVKTLSDSGNKALGFYKKLGFTTVQEFSYLGRTMALLKLKIQSSVNTF